MVAVPYFATSSSSSFTTAAEALSASISTASLTKSPFAIPFSLFEQRRIFGKVIVDDLRINVERPKLADGRNRSRGNGAPVELWWQVRGNRLCFHVVYDA